MDPRFGLGLGFLVSLLVELAQTQSYGDDPVIFCYYSSTAQYRRGLGRFIPEDIDTTLCTHVIFAFANVVNGRYLQAANREHLTGTDGGLCARTIALKRQNPRLKVLLALGGWAVGSEPFVAILASEANRRAFVRNTVRFLRRHNFDGLDIDWEFPGVRGSPPEDKYRFTTLLRELQEAFQQEARRSGREKLLLTLAAAGGTYFINKAYEPEKIVQFLDYLLVMTYNYHGSWNDFTGHHSGLKPRSDEVGGEREWNQAWTIDYWLATGISPKRMVVGVPTYGMSFTLTDPSQHGLRSPASGAGKKGKYTQEQGILSYYEMCESLDNGWHSEWIDEQKSPYAYLGNQWVGYEDVDSVGYKARYIREKGLGGAFIWSVEMDDFRGTCGSGKYPLLSTIAGILRGEIDVPIASTNQISRSRSRVIRRRKIKKPKVGLARSYSEISTVESRPTTVSDQLVRRPYKDVDLPRDRLDSRPQEIYQYGDGVLDVSKYESQLSTLRPETNAYLKDYDDYEAKYHTTRTSPLLRDRSYDLEPKPKAIGEEPYAYYDYEDDSAGNAKTSNHGKINGNSVLGSARVGLPPSLQDSLQERLLEQKTRARATLDLHPLQASLENGLYNGEKKATTSLDLVQEYGDSRGLTRHRTRITDLNRNAKRGRDTAYDELTEATTSDSERDFGHNTVRTQLAQREMLQALNRRREEEQLEQQQRLQQQQLLLQQRQQQQQQLALQQRTSTNKRRGEFKEAASIGGVPTEENKVYTETEEVCLREGLFPHPGSCSAYYICVQHGGRMYNFLMRCPASLTFDPETADCVYDVTCSGNDVSLVK